MIALNKAKGPSQNELRKSIQSFQY